MESRQERITALARENRGRQKRPEYLRTLSIALQEPVSVHNLLSHEATDAMSEALWEGYHHCLDWGALRFRRSYTQIQAAEPFAIVRCLAARLGDRKAVLLTRDSEDCGAVQIRASAALANAIAMVELGDQSLMLVSLDAVQGLVLDWNPDDRFDTFELTVWGSSWPRETLLCSERVL